MNFCVDEIGGDVKLGIIGITVEIETIRMILPSGSKYMINRH